MTDQIKFKYDIQNGAIEYEGAHELLKPTLKSLAKMFNGGTGALPKVKGNSKKITPKTEATKDTPGASKPKKASGGYKPKFNSHLNLLELLSFVESLVLKTNTEYVVAFLVFLTEELELGSISGDDIYTCFFTLKTKLKVPNIVSTLKNAQNKERVIKYDTGFTNITLPPAGSNLYHHDIIKREQAEK